MRKNEHGYADKVLEKYETRKSGMDEEYLMFMPRAMLLLALTLACQSVALIGVALDMIDADTCDWVDYDT